MSRRTCRGELRIEVELTFDESIHPHEAFCTLIEAVAESNAPELLIGKSIQYEGEEVRMIQAEPSDMTSMLPEEVFDA